MLEYCREANGGKNTWQSGTLGEARDLIQVLSRVDVGVWVARLRISAYRGLSVWEAVGGFEVYGFGFRCGFRVRPGFWVKGLWRLRLRGVWVLFAFHASLHYLEFWILCARLDSKP